MWVTRYPRPKKITYGQGSEFIGREFRKSPIEKYYWITAKPSTLGYTTSNTILERIHQVLGNLVMTFKIKGTYVDEDDPWFVILDAAEFTILSPANRLKVIVRANKNIAVI